MMRYVSVNVGQMTFTNVDLRSWFIGSLISTLSYGIVVALVLALLHNFIRMKHQKIKDQQAQSKAYTFPLVYTLFMFGLSTIAFATVTVETLDFFFDSPNVNAMHYNLAQYGEAACMVLASWTADALMVSRYFILILRVCLNSESPALEVYQSLQELPQDSAIVYYLHYTFSNVSWWAQI